jgi:hypothetical protein
MKVIIQGQGNGTTWPHYVTKSSPEYVILQVSGTFSGAKVVLQAAIQGLPFLDIDGFSLTAPGILEVKLRSDMEFRFVISGGTSPVIAIAIAGGGY